MLVEIHVLQNLSPSNPNRDDVGAPKSAYFGGVPRGRMSSQSLKRAIREYAGFRDALKGHLGVRTKLFPELVRERLATSAAIPKDDHARIVAACTRIAKAEKTSDGKKEKEPADHKARTPQLIFLGPTHAEEFVARLERARGKYPTAYAFYLDPVAGFQEEMAAALEAAESLDDDQQKGVVKNAWVLATLRLAQLKQFAGEEEPGEPPGPEGADPTPETAAWVVGRLDRLAQSDEKADKERLVALLKKPNPQEGKQLKTAAPDKPKDFDRFAAELFEPLKTNAVDVALFGRMTTSDAFEDVEACLEVAHAVSTNQLVREVDYFTAVDDHRTGAAAAHVGENQFNSNTFYKYFSLDWDAFVKHLGGTPEARALAETALRALVEAVVHSMPSGKKKGHANNNPPDAVLVEVKTKNVPTSYANAFLTPAAPTPDANVVRDSIRKLGHYAGQVSRLYEVAAERVWFDTDERPLVGWKQKEPYDLAPAQPSRSAFLDAVLAAVRKGGA